MGREKRAALLAPFEIQPQATLDPLKLKPSLDFIGNVFFHGPDLGECTQLEGLKSLLSPQPLSFLCNI